MATLEKIDKRKADYSEISYCHIMCECHPVLAMCGAYKPLRCGVLVVAQLQGDCPVCGKAFCPDCNEYLNNECPRCGG